MATFIARAAAPLAGIGGVAAAPLPLGIGAGTPPPGNGYEVLIHAVNALGVQIMGLRREVETLREENSDLRDGVRALNEEITELRRENAALAAQVVELNQKVAQLQEQLDKERADNATLQNRIAQLYNQIANQVPQKKRRHGLGKLLHKAEKLVRPVIKAAAPHLIPALTEKLVKA